MSIIDEKTFSRGTFLKGTGALVVSLALPVELLSQAGEASAQTPAYLDIPLTQVDSWLAVGPDGLVTAFLGRIDMGTGAETLFRQVIAEELDVAFSAVTTILGDTARTPNQGKSTASNAVTSGSQPIRVVAAAARQHLVDMAATRLGVPAEQLITANGAVSVKSDSSKSVKYGELIGNQKFNVTVQMTANGGFGPTLASSASVKDPSQYKILGTSVPRVDVPDKVSGAFTFIQDLKLPGMLHGRVVHPASVGATLQSVESLSSLKKKVPDVVEIVQKGNFLGVVARSEWGAIRAARAIKVNWSASNQLPSSDGVYADLKTRTTIKDVTESTKGNVTDGLQGAAKTLDQTYTFPFSTHGLLGPSCAVADVQPGKATIYAGTQWPDGTHQDIAQMLGIPLEQVRVVWYEASGSYGRLGVDDAAADAVLMSQAVGKPVRVQWMRDDEHGWSPFNPAAVMRVQAGVDAGGNVVAWNYENWTTSHSSGELGNELAWRLIGTAPGWARLSGAADSPQYAFPNQQVVSHYKQEVLRAVYMRSVGGIQNTFAIESMLDELAAAIGKDPLDFRLQHLKDPRAINVLRTAAQKLGWTSRPSPQRQSGTVVTGRGIALASTSYMAHAVEVQVNKQTGVVTVTRVAAVHDAGMIMNPGLLYQQTEAGTIMGISRALKEELTFDTARVTSLNWDQYPILRFTEVPEMQIELVNSTNPPKGAGEPPNVPPAAAIGNAIFDATGVRVRSVPFSPARVKAALAG